MGHCVLIIGARLWICYLQHSQLSCALETVLMAMVGLDKNLIVIVLLFIQSLPCKRGQKGSLIRHPKL